MGRVVAVGVVSEASDARVLLPSAVAREAPAALREGRAAMRAGRAVMTTGHAVMTTGHAALRVRIVPRDRREVLRDFADPHRMSRRNEARALGPRFVLPGSARNPEKTRKIEAPAAGRRVFFRVSRQMRRAVALIGAV